MHYDPRSETSQQPISLIQQCTGPRPVAWLSSVNSAGEVDLSVFPHWQWLATGSPLLTFSAEQTAATERARAVVNAEQTGWFVWNMATAELSDSVLKSHGPVPRDIDAFQHAGVAKAPSITAQCPRVAQSPAHLECRYISTQRLPGIEPRHFIDIVLAEVVRVHIKDEFFSTENLDDNSFAAALQPLLNCVLIQNQ